MKLCVAMLVRDEEQRIKEAIVTASTIADKFVIVDTGSTDQTIEIAEDLIGAPVHRRSWVGFAANRTDLLELARVSTDTDFTLMLDADHKLHFEGQPPDVWDADSYLIPIRGSLQWRLPLLTRNSKPFRYAGAAHAYLMCDEPVVSAKLDWFSIEGGPGATDAKLEKDRVLLEEAFAADPSDTRTVFYLAQTFRFLGEHDRAISLYRMRAEMGGFAEEAWYARYWLGRLLCEHVSYHQGAPELIRAFSEQPGRAEPLRALATVSGNIADKLPVPDGLFVETDAYKKEEE